MKAPRSMCLGIAGTMLLAVAAGLHANEVDFNNTSDLNTYFNGSTGASAVNSASGGLSNSGSVSIDSSTQLWTSKESLSLSLGTTASVSLYFYNAHNSGYGGLGFAVAATNNPNTASGDYLNEYSAANSIGTVFHGGGGSFTNNLDTAGTGEELNWFNTGDMPLNSWMKITFTLTQTGVDLYAGTLLIQTADSTGTVLSTFTTQSFSGYQNSALAAGSTVHAYFSAAGSRFDTADNFSSSTAVPEPSTYALIGLGVLALAGLRRRPRIAA